MRDLIQSLKLIALALVMGLGLNLAMAWSGPTQAPPAGNTPAPVNVGSDTQVKSGSLELGTGSLDQGTKDWLAIYNRGVVANKNFNGSDNGNLDVGTIGLGRTAGVRGDGNFAGIIGGSSDQTGGYDFYGMGPQSRFPKVIAGQYCFGTSAPGTNCITDWLSGITSYNQLPRGATAGHCINEVTARYPNSTMPGTVKTATEPAYAEDVPQSVGQKCSCREGFSLAETGGFYTLGNTETDGTGTFYFTCIKT